jgi:acetyltransferase-like isoleucine patch superfamily enzyme
MKFNNRNIHIGKNVILGQNVKIGDNTTIYDNVEIGDNTIICNDCVLGEPNYTYYSEADYLNPILKIGSNALIRSHAIIYAGSIIGNFFQTGHRVTIREKTQIGNHCSVGSYNDIQGDCVIGNYVRMHSYVNVGQKSKIDDFVFIYPFVVLTNDPTPPSNKLLGVSIGKYSQVTTGCVLLPGTTIGENCLLGANSTVGGCFDDFSFVNGSPATRVCDVRKAPFFNIETQKRHYPWQNNFKRGMPWAEEGFEEWNNNKKND